MKELLKLAKKIEDEGLRKKIVEFLRNPILTHRDFKKYPRTEIEKTKSIFTVGNMAVEREFLIHIKAMVEICIRMADAIQKNYGLVLNKDHLVAAALLHDIMKIYEWKDVGGTPEHSGITLDHTMLAVAELYHRGFPEEIIHIIASHFGEVGPTPPRTFEAFLFHHLDSLVSLFEYYFYSMKRPKQQVPLVFLDEEMLKKLEEIKKGGFKK
jgi:7,8-dihydroneopterin 2',3'-cyclic phosphate phosphodiesterase